MFNKFWGQTPTSHGINGRVVRVKSSEACKAGSISKLPRFDFRREFIEKRERERERDRLRRGRGRERGDCDAKKKTKKKRKNKKN